MRTLCCSFLALLAALPAGAAPPDMPPPAQPPTPTKSDIRATVDGSNLLGLQLSDMVGEKAGNFVVSPYSICLALNMVFAGAAGVTAEEIASAMHVSGAPAQSLNAAWAKVAADMAEEIKRGGERAITLNVANRAWAALNLPLRAEYSAYLQQVFGADVGRLDFTQPTTAADAINKWVKEQTRGLIGAIVSADNLRAQGLVLTNTVYFKGRWSEPFSKGSTNLDTFTLADGTTAEVPMMRQTERFAYAEGAVGAGGPRPVPVQVASLKYESGADALVILPANRDQLPALVRQLASPEGMKQLAQLGEKMAPREVRLGLPRFTIESKQSVADMLQGLGVRQAFTDQAQFPGISSDVELKISDVLHAGKMIVDEFGTEAAAATAVIMAPTSAAPAPEEPVVMTANRPFLVIIRERATGTWLFIAKVNDPRG